MDDTIRYYDENAEVFIEGTRDVEFTDLQDGFLKYLKKGSRILDLGCGSGRDTKYFLDRGFQTDAIDGSAEICRQASAYTGIHVKEMLFQELDISETYDGIWACASLLHLPYDELVLVFQKIARALNENAVFYVSFKYGEFEGWRKGRHFTDMTERRTESLLSKTAELKMKEMWITTDVRPGRDEERWLNIILVKCSQNQK